MSASCGTITGYQAGCRCRYCRVAQSRYMNEYRDGQRRLVDSTGTNRRVQALCVAGWSIGHIESEADLCPRTLGNAQKQATVSPETARKVRQVYARLSYRQGPSEYVRRRAAREGWHPALAWTERTIDDPQARPNVSIMARQPMRRADYLEEYTFLLSTGQSKEHAANRLGVTVLWLDAIMEGTK